MAEAAPIGWIVDVQKDLVLPEGRLYLRAEEEPAPAGIPATERLERAALWLRSCCEVLIYTGEWHAEDGLQPAEVHSGASPITFPPHCLGQSADPHKREGAWILESIRPLSPVVLETGSSTERGREAARQAVREKRPVFIQKSRLDVFQGNPTTDPFLRGLQQALSRPLHFFVMGVARDVAVTRAVDGLRERGHAVTVLQDATWGWGVEPEEATLARWRRSGVLVHTLQELPAP